MNRKETDNLNDIHSTRSMTFQQCHDMLKTIKSSSLLDVIVVLVIHYKQGIFISEICKTFKIYRSRYYDIFKIIEMRTQLTKSELYSALDNAYHFDDLQVISLEDYALNLVKLMTDDVFLIKRWERKLNNDN